MEEIVNLFHGFAVVLQPFNMVLMVIGILLGVIIGVLPGLGGANGVAILLPLTFSMSPTSAIIMLSCIYWGALFGGAITSVLFNIPGEPWSVATTFDGHPMAQQGRAGEALTAAFTSSFVGALFAVIVITLVAPLVARFALQFGPAEKFSVYFLAYVVTNLELPKSWALDGILVGAAMGVVLVIATGALSDRVGRRPVYLFGALCGIALAVPFFLMVGTRHWLWMTLAFVLSRAVVIAAMFGPQAAYFAELFAPTRRYSGFAFARELGSVLAGGPAPFVATALVAWAGGSWWPVALYIVLLSGVTAFAVWCGPETYRDDISMDASEPALKT